MQPRTSRVDHRISLFDKEEVGDKIPIVTAANIIDAMADIDLLALTLVGEDRGNHDDEGVKYIAHTILNRVDHPSGYGKTIRDVVLAPAQFSCWADHNKDVMITSYVEKNKTYLRMLDLAKEVLAERAEGVNPIPGVYNFIAMHSLEEQDNIVTAYIDRYQDPPQRKSSHWAVGMKIVARTTHGFLKA